MAELKEVNFYRGSSGGFEKLDKTKFTDGGTFFYTEDNNKLYVVGNNGDCKCLTETGGANITDYTVDVPADGWDGDATKGRTNTITTYQTKGILASDEPIVDVVLEGNDALANKTALQNWAKISHVLCGNDQITLYSYAAEVPSAFKIKLKVVK